VPEIRVAVADASTGTGLRRLSCADPDAVGEATLTAVTVTESVVGSTAGGVYTPAAVMVPTLLLPPVTPFTCQVTAVLVRIVTVAEKLVVLPRRTWLAPETVTDGWGVILPPPVPQPVSVTASVNADNRTFRKSDKREPCKLDLPRA